MPCKATNPQNLIPQNERPIEERRRIARMGQIASTEAKRNGRRTARERLVESGCFREYLCVY